MDQAAESLRVAHDALHRERPAWSSVLGTTSGPVVGAEETAGNLPRGVVMLEYCLWRDDLLVWAVTSEGLVSWARLSAGTQVSRAAVAFAAACGRRPGAFAKGDVRKPGEELSAALLSPVREVIEKSRGVVVVPHGVLHTVPFQALPWQGGMLAEGRALTYLPSASVLASLPSQAEPKLSGPMLAVGVSTPVTYRPPQGGQLPLLPLPGARAEAVFAANIFPRSQALLDEAAQADHVRDLAPHYKLLHFAAHCEVVPASPLETAIVLADGGLPMHSVVALPLHAELVALSACSSAAGPVTQGDEVLSLTRALLMAGAHSAVVTLWKVYDFSTSLLMFKFYSRLRDGTPPVVALSEAQSWLRSLRRREAMAAMDDLGVPIRSRVSMPPRDFDHPYYWAPFQFVGRPLPLPSG